MSKNRKLILQETERWLKDGIIDRSQADRISALYSEEAPSRNWGPLIFSVIGAIIFGLGIILLFAYNWDAIPKFAKLALIFSALVAAHGGGFYFRLKGEKYAALSESLFALGTMIFGSGIWLVAQIYNIDEHYPNAFIVWGAGALMLAWALPSIVQGVMASILLVLWGAFENFDFDSRMNIPPLLIIVLIFPLAWKMRSRIFMAVAVPAFVLSVLFNCHYFFERAAPALFISVAALLLALAVLVRKKNLFPESSAVFAVYGNILYWISLYIFTFPDADRHIFRSYWFEEINSAIYVIVAAVLALAAWSLVIFPLGKFKEDLNRLYRMEHFAVPVTVMVVTLNFGWLSEFEGWGGASVFNLIFLFQSIMLISFGCRNVNSKLTAAGTVLLAFLAFARYADLFDSLLMRGIVFLGVGAGIFIVGMLYSRRKKEAREVKA
ncbi:MAG: DUF2157 domain-containing protein [Victivallales bacterium]